MGSHNMIGCRTLRGISGFPVLNAGGKVIGLVFSEPPLIPGCRSLNAIPLIGFQSINLMSFLKTNKEDIVKLIQEKELLFYNQLLFNNENKKDLTVRAIFYSDNGMILSGALQSQDEEFWMGIYQRLSDAKQDLDAEAVLALKFLVQRNITNMQGFDIQAAIQLGSVEAKFALGMQLYSMWGFTEAHKLLQEIIQLRIPLHLYALSKLYYREDNPTQACRLLTYAGEPVEALDDLYREYECAELLVVDPEKVSSVHITLPLLREENL